MNQNRIVVNEMYNYMMMPGDGTLYRFGFCFYPKDQEDAYVLDSGVGEHPDMFYIKLFVNMPYGTGIACVRKDEILHFPEWGIHVVGYLKGHGLEKCNDFSIVAILLALKVLIIDTNDIERAARYMMDARKVLFGKEDE
jgi:hypothetical protein